MISYNRAANGRPLAYFSLNCNDAHRRLLRPAHR
jgi:hypothetical protein